MKFKRNQLVTIKPSASFYVRSKFGIDMPHRILSNKPDRDGDVMLKNKDSGSWHYVHIDHLLPYITKPQTRRTAK